LKFVFVAAEEAQVLRFAAGETDILNRVNARYLSLLGNNEVTDLGPGLEYTFLFFNLGPGANPWFSNLAFRQAVSAAIDREAIARLVFAGRATPLWVHVPPGNRLWVNGAITKQPRSLEKGRELLTKAGFHWDGSRNLVDAEGKRVLFSLMTSAGNQDRSQIAAIIAEDLRQLGMEVRVATVEFRSLLDRVLNTHQYDACVLSLGGGDADPNSEMNVWLSGGATHIWNPRQDKPAAPWEAEMDDLMRRQLTTLNHSERKTLFDRLQEIEAAQLPIISLVSPHILTAAKPSIGNFRPAVLDHYTLWNAEYLFLRSGAPR
jgi:peptide/nickel transport system substrate-binding protein